MRASAVALGLFVVVWTANGAEALPNAVIVPAGSEVPAPLTVDAAGGNTLELVSGRTRLPAPDSIRLSLWVVGGPVLAPLVRDQPFHAEVGTDARGATRYRFQLPAFEARPGATLRVVLSGPESGRILAEAWLVVREHFDPTALRRWAEQKGVAVDPALKEVLAAFTAWQIPLRDAGEAAIFITGSESASGAPSGVRLVLLPSKDGRVRIVVPSAAGNGSQIRAALPNLAGFATDASARQDFLSALHEAGALLGDGSNFPLP